MQLSACVHNCCEPGVAADTDGLAGECVTIRKNQGATQMGQVRTASMLGACVCALHTLLNLQRTTRRCLNARTSCRSVLFLSEHVANASG